MGGRLGYNGTKNAQHVDIIYGKLKHARMLHYLWYFTDKSLIDEGISGIQVSVVTRVNNACY